jgi:ABC-type maltose transport system permease subunit
MKKKGKDVKWIRKSSTSLLILMLFTMGMPVAFTTITSAQQPTQMTVKTPSLLDPADTVILLLDHQSGLFQTVKDISVAELRTNTAILAKVGKLAKVPVITTERPEGSPDA